MSDAQATASVYVGRISFNSTDEDRLREVFGEHGTVTGVKIIDRTVPDRMNPEREKRQKFGFVEYGAETQEAADAMANAAIAALNETDLDGQNIVVKMAEKREQSGDRSGGGFNRGGGRSGNYQPRNGGDRYGGNRW